MNFEDFFKENVTEKGLFTGFSFYAIMGALMLIVAGIIGFLISIIIINLNIESLNLTGVFIQTFLQMAFILLGIGYICFFVGVSFRFFILKGLE